MTFLLCKSRSLLSKAEECSRSKCCFICIQTRSLVNLKLKWVKDKTLDSSVTRMKNVKAASRLVTVLSRAPECCLPTHQLSSHRGQLGVQTGLRLTNFMRKNTSIFTESETLDYRGSRVPCFGLTREAHELREEELRVAEENHTDILNRLCKLLMLTKDRVLPLRALHQLKWELGLPYDFHRSFIPRHPDLFSLVQLSHEEVGLKLNVWDDDLAVSELQRTSSSENHDCLSFPIGFTRGFGLKRKCMEWLREWQTLPYTSPYSDSSHLDSRTDVSEKRIVGVFHELLHLSIEKRIERKNVSNLRKPFALPQKFTKVFERHPGIFYISMKGDKHTVILREAYDGRRLLHKHPLIAIREKLASLLRQGYSYKKPPRADTSEDTLGSLD